MKSLLLLWKEMADDFAIRCCTSATMDFKTVQERSKHEGLSFLTITLSDFAKDLQKGLDQGSVDRRLFASFKRKGELPRFLGGFLDLVFDRSSGRLLNDPSIDAILAMRQLTLVYSKISLPCTAVREKRAMDSFIECEQDVRSLDSRLSSINLEDFQRVSDLLFRRVFTVLDHKIYYNGTIPKHGPGSTADRLVANEKFNQRTWTERLDAYFPFGEYLLPSHSYYSEYEKVDILEPGREIPVRVISVPKTQKTPRIIAIEPTAMQYAQQGILEILLEQLSRDDILDTVIGFDDQTPNQRMALEGSLHGDLATLDLSEASDRVSCQLVWAMMRHHPHLRGAVDACRSRKADVPGHGIIRLSKFASMGSALCFPVEAMVFTTLIFLGIEQELNRHLTRRDLHDLKGKVRVYGDDIIVPVTYVRSVVSILEHFGARVNRGKSFWTGMFRESCGKEYYAGYDVSVVKFRHLFPTQRRDATGVISLVSFRNQCYKAGYWRTCKWLDTRISRVIKYYPVVADTSPVLGRHSYLGYQTDRIGSELHNPLVKGWVVTARPPKSFLDGPGALLKFFLKRSGLPEADRRHLERSGRPHAVNIKLRWASPF